jgi:hypothetical protein
MIRARFAPLSPASGFPVSIFPSFQITIAKVSVFSVQVSAFTPLFSFFLTPETRHLGQLKAGYFSIIILIA